MEIGDKITDGTVTFLVRSTGGYRVSIMFIQTMQAI